MQHRMNMRQRPTISKSKEADGSQNPNPTRGQIDEQSKVLNGVAEGTTSRSIHVHVVGAEIVDETEGATNLSVRSQPFLLLSFPQVFVSMLCSSTEYFQIWSFKAKSNGNQHIQRFKEICC